MAISSSTCDPANAPTVFNNNLEVQNYMIGTEWTLQGVIKNPDASSPKNASVTNAIKFSIQ